MENAKWNYIVLGVALLLDGFSFFTARKEFNEQRGKTKFWKAIKNSRDPTTFVVLFEDAADLMGLLIALIGIFLGHYFENPYFDGIASILIGIILTGVAILLAKETRGLLIGKTIESTTLEGIVIMTENDASVDKVLRTLSMYMGPKDVILILPVAFSPDLNTNQITDSIKRIKKTIQKDFPDIQQIFIEPNILPKTIM